MSNMYRNALSDREFAALAKNKPLRKTGDRFVAQSAKLKYTYGFSWMGRPFIQFPQDIVAMQELIWTVRPDLIVETGIAHGGGLVFYASLLELIGGKGKVVGIDIEIRPHNRKAIEAHPMAKRIRMIERSSTDPVAVSQVAKLAAKSKRVLVVLDSLHTHAHVLEELKLYSPLVGKGSYLVVFDTLIETMPKDTYPDRPWGKGDNPRTAVYEFLRSTNRFEIDREFERKLFLTVAPDGYLKCIKNPKR